MRRESTGRRASGRRNQGIKEPEIHECFGWRDDEIEVFFPPSLAGNAMLFRQTYGDSGLGYSLRYGFFGSNADDPHFDLYVYDHGERIPDDDGGVLRIHVAEMVNSLVAVSDPRSPVAADGHFPDTLAGDEFGKTGIHYLSTNGSFRRLDTGTVFGTAMVLFPFRGKFIKIRYSEPWCEKTPDTFEETFERIEENLLEGRPNLFNRVGAFLDSLDGLLFGSLKPEKRRLLQAARTLGIRPGASNKEAVLYHDYRTKLAEAEGRLTNDVRKRLDRARDIFLSRSDAADGIGEVEKGKTP